VLNPQKLPMDVKFKRVPAIDQCFSILDLLSRKEERLSISESSTKKDVEEAMKGHVLDDDQIIGSFGP